jgi:hypothetical protein
MSSTLGGSEGGVMSVISGDSECGDEIPKFLTKKKCLFTWQPEHSCAAIDLICFNLFMFLSPKG